jgi:hypothetical protein
MKTKLLLVSAVTFLGYVGISAQTVELAPSPPGNTDVLKTSVTNGVASTFQWTENDPLNIITGVTGNADSITIVASPSATDGQTATVSVEAISISASCASDPQTVTIVIRTLGNMTFKASFGTAPAPICQGSSALFSIKFNEDSVTSYKYFIDLDGNGILSPGETEVTRTLTAPSSSDSISVLITTPGTRSMVITSISGIYMGQHITSSADVSQSVSVNAKPTISDIKY